MFPYDLLDAVLFRMVLSLRTTRVDFVSDHHYRCNDNDNQERESAEPGTRRRLPGDVRHAVHYDLQINNRNMV